MKITELYLLNFKNYEERKFHFTGGFNAIVGKNGTGKTNLLDAVYLLCLTKSAFATTDSQNLKHKEQFFVVQGIFEQTENQQTELQCSLQQGKSKMMRVNKVAYPKVNQHIGKYPCVLITPYDTDLIREGSETRRKFFDATLCQASPHYLTDLLEYNQLLQQRNSLLKQFAERNYHDKTLLQVYTEKLLPLNQRIYLARKEAVENFTPIFQQYYQEVASETETVSLHYNSDLQNPNFELLFEQTLPKDLVLQRTNKGIHKDDYSFEINGFSANRYGSQGQQKSFVIALKLAQYEQLRRLKGFNPILLLDDIFDKLDGLRMAQLMRLLGKGNFGQVLLTDANPERTKLLFEQIGYDLQIIQL